MPVQITSNNQNRISAKLVLGGPDTFPETNNGIHGQEFRQSTAKSILQENFTQKNAPPGLEKEIERHRSAATGAGISFNGTA